MSSSLGEIAKKLILVFGKSPSEGFPGHPNPPPAQRLELVTLTRGETPHWVTKTGRQNETPECGGESHHFSNNSTMLCGGKWQTLLISFLRGWQVKTASYIVKAEPIKGAWTSRQPSVDCTPFYRQQLCEVQCIQERSQPQQHMWNSKPLLFFPLNYCCT